MLKDNEPVALPTELNRLSENGSGIVQWGHETDYDLETVLKPGFFRRANKHGLQKHDRIHVTCNQHEPTVTYATLVVTCGRHGAVLEVAQLGEAHTIEITNLTWFERLGVQPTATPADIENAYRERAKKVHPDKGGSKSAMQELNKAKDEGLLVAQARAA